MLITWQPRVALRKLSTERDMGAAPVTMTRTLPPRDSYDQNKYIIKETPKCKNWACFTLVDSVSMRLFYCAAPALCGRWVCPRCCCSWWFPPSPQQTSAPRQSSAAISWKAIWHHSEPGDRTFDYNKWNKKLDVLSWWLKQSERKQGVSCPRGRIQTFNFS